MLNIPVRKLTLIQTKFFLLDSENSVKIQYEFKIFIDCRYNRLIEDL